MTAALAHKTPPVRSIGWSLDAVNFFVSDVRGAFGPFVNVYLVSQLHWTPGSVGLIMMVGGLVGLVTETPIGWAIDHTIHKRGALIAALVILTLSGMVIYAVPGFWPVMVANAAIAVVGDVFVPAVAALTLGLYAHRFLARRLGRNAAYEHAGNAAVALLAAAAGYFFSQRAVFLLAPGFAVLAVLAVLSIPHDAIDLDRARGLEGRHQHHERRHKAARWRDLFKHRALVVFAVAALLFQFANAPLLSLVGQKFALAHPEDATVMLSACIIAAQLVMLGVSVFAGLKADKWGAKPILLIGFAALPLRAALFAVSDDSYWVIGFELLDGVSAGIFAMMMPLIVADGMRGTGRYNLALGAIGTMQGVGASISLYTSGLAVEILGYRLGFVGLCVAGTAALLVILFFLPETRPTSRRPAASVPPRRARPRPGPKSHPDS
jgi:MFS family permease